MCFQRTLIGDSKLQASARSFLCLLAAACLVLSAGPSQAWASAATTTTALAVTSGGNPVTTVTPGTVVTLTATVNAGSDTVSPGQINFCDATAKSCTDIHLLGTAQLTSAGTATLKFRPGPGSHSYQAVFLGTGSDAASSSAASALSVTGPYLSTTVIAASGNPGDYSLTATVLSNGPAAPTGNISFVDTTNANAALATAALTPGTPGLNLITSFIVNLSQPYAVFAGDFNGDGIPDLALTPYLTILLGNGDGTFAPAPTQMNPGVALSAAVADFNSDGKLDIAFTDNNTGTVSIELGNGDGTFTTAYTSTETGASPGSIAVGDFNGDGNVDLAVANYFSGAVSIFLGNGDGTLTAVTPAVATGSMMPSSITAGDFNGDGKLDLAVGSFDSNTVTILLGNGDGTFSAAAPATGSASGPIVAGDFNGDGKLDLAIANPDSDTVTILLGNGDGTFTPAAGTAAGDSVFGVGDFNGDGIADLVVVDAELQQTILLGKGDGTFTVAPTQTPADDAESFTIADFNGDGLSDLAYVPVIPAGDPTGVQLASMQSATAVANNVTPTSPTTDLVDATYSGDADNQASTSGTIGLNQFPYGVTLTNTPIAIASPGNSGTSAITLTPRLGFTGTVALSCVVNAPSSAINPPTCAIDTSATIVSTAAVTATLTVNTQATTSAGTYPVIVTSSLPDSTLAAITTVVTASVAAQGPQPPEFLLSSGQPGGVYPGSMAEQEITITPLNGFTGPVTFSCALTSSPSGAIDLPVCSVPSPVTISETTPGSVLVTLQTTAGSTAALHQPLLRIFRIGGGAALSALIFLGLPARRKKWQSLLSSLLLLAAVGGAAIGCGMANPPAAPVNTGTTGGGTTGGSAAATGTTAGNYVVTVTGTGGNATASTVINFSVN